MLRRQSSRLNRNIERQNKKQAITFTIAIILLVFGLFQFGPTLINIFGDVIFTIRGEEENTQIIGEEVFQPPLLIGIPSATQSATISFSGTSSVNKGVIEIYVNDDLAKEVRLRNNSNFEVKDVRLKSGANEVKARIVDGKKTSPFSDVYSISYLKDKPKLEIDSPSDNSAFTKADKKITVSGKTDPDNTVTVNGFRAIVASDGSFSYYLELADGENFIKVVAENPAGITSEKDIRVNYTP